MILAGSVAIRRSGATNPAAIEVEAEVGVEVEGNEVKVDQEALIESIAEIHRVLGFFFFLNYSLMEHIKNPTALIPVHQPPSRYGGRVENCFFFLRLCLIYFIFWCDKAPFFFIQARRRKHRSRSLSVSPKRRRSSSIRKERSARVDLDEFGREKSTESDEKIDVTPVFEQIPKATFPSQPTSGQLKSQEKAEAAKKELEEQQEWLKNRSRNKAQVSQSESTATSSAEVAGTSLGAQYEFSGEDGRAKLEERINQLAAKAMKAKIKNPGDSSAQERINQQIADLRAEFEHYSSKIPIKPPMAQDVRIITQLDSMGRPLNLLESTLRALPVAPAAKSKSASRKPVNKMDAEGNRTAYLDSDVSQSDLRTLVQQQRLGLADDYDDRAAHNIMKNSSYKVHFRTLLISLFLLSSICNSMINALK